MNEYLNRRLKTFYRVNKVYTSLFAVHLPFLGTAITFFVDDSTSQTFTRGCQMFAAAYRVQSSSVSTAVSTLCSKKQCRMLNDKYRVPYYERYILLQKLFVFVFSGNFPNVHAGLLSEEYWRTYTKLRRNKLKNVKCLLVLGCEMKAFCIQAINGASTEVTYSHETVSQWCFRGFSVCTSSDEKSCLCLFCVQIKLSLIVHLPAMGSWVLLISENN